MARHACGDLIMSIYHLCDTCENEVAEWTATICECSAKGEVQKIAVCDGTEQPERLCDDYESKEDGYA